MDTALHSNERHTHCQRSARKFRPAEETLVDQEKDVTSMTVLHPAAADNEKLKPLLIIPT
jgi:hypothetical protein